MKYLVFASLLAISSVSMANEEYGEAGTEKAEAELRNAKRKAKKATHRASEATCTEGAVGCTGEKIKNRAIEAKDYTKDKAKQLKNKVD